jgi:DNA (cytosine-5)-methyltransferase 1
MTEIEEIPWNGHDVVSTFSGCGGSCLGYRMAGYRVLWASEFIPAAQKVYKENHPDSVLDTRDIREVKSQEILDAIDQERGEVDILDGSPPCSDFSTAGKGSEGWGEVKDYSDTKQRVDDLFFEYARILEGLQPKVFVAENVKGLVRGKAKGYFKEILRELKGCGYDVQAKVLDAQWLGVPQRRQRLIFVGVRNDLDASPAHPDPLPYRYSVREAVDDLPSDGVRLKGYAVHDKWYDCDANGNHPSLFNLKRLRWHEPANTLCQTWGRGTAAITMPDEPPRYPSIAELKRLQAFPDDFELTGNRAQRWERIARTVPPVMMKHIAATIRDDILNEI